MLITATNTIDSYRKQRILQLWNEEYPSALCLPTENALDMYLLGLQNSTHYFLELPNDFVAGWGIVFDRENERWFAIILSTTCQGKGYGTQLLNRLKGEEMLLNGWVIDHNNDVKSNGEPYLSPLPFYVKNGFQLQPDIRLETDTISAVKIVWGR